MSLNSFPLLHICGLHSSVCHQHPTPATQKSSPFAGFPHLVPSTPVHLLHHFALHLQSNRHNHLPPPEDRRPKSSCTCNIPSNPNQCVFIITFQCFLLQTIRSSRLAYLQSSLFTQEILTARYWTRPEDTAMSKTDVVTGLMRDAHVLPVCSDMCLIKNVVPLPFLEGLL